MMGPRRQMIMMGLGLNSRGPRPHGRLQVVQRQLGVRFSPGYDPYTSSKPCKIIQAEVLATLAIKTDLRSG